MKLLKQSLIFFIFFTFVLGGLYPAFVMGVSNVFFKGKASGEIIEINQEKRGAKLIGQEFTEDKYFWGRPSAAHYNASASTGSNYSLTSKVYQDLVAERKKKGLDFDLLEASASGLDPHISLRAALSQVPRVAKVRGIDEKSLATIVKHHLEERQFGLLGEERVNVLLLNLAVEGIGKNE